MRATKDSIVLDILKSCPAAIKVFHKFHLYPFRDLDSSLETLASKDGAGLEALLEELNEAIASPPGTDEAVGAAPGHKVHQNMSFRLITTRHPATRDVFDRYKVLAPAEEHWPDEKVSFFAMGLHLSTEKLVDELNEAVAETTAAQPAEGSSTQPENIHVTFMKMAVAFMLTTGCLYGAAMLFYFGMNGTLSGIPKAMLEAHGHTQVYGWIGLFIMGISYFALPRFWGTTLHNPFIAGKTLYPMTIGIVLVFLSRHLLLMGNYTLFWVMAVAGGCLEVLAICLFIYLMVHTYRSNTGRKFEVYEAYFFAGYTWFLIQAVIFVGTLVYMAFNGVNAVPHLVAQPLLHMQIMGFACMVILGILTKTLPI
ncbi:MAG: hypothetical protein V3V45_03605, partial [Candidatus Brocadiales bacterium]